jgi:hypothetical protein
LSAIGRPAADISSKVQQSKETLVFCPVTVTDDLHSGEVRVRVSYEGPPEGAKRLASELRAAGFTVDNGPPPEHPDILVDDARAVLWVSIEGDQVRSIRHVRAFVASLMSQYPSARIEIGDVLD